MESSESAFPSPFPALSSIDIFKSYTVHDWQEFFKSLKISLQNEQNTKYNCDLLKNGSFDFKLDSIY